MYFALAVFLDIDEIYFRKFLHKLHVHFF